MLKTYWPLKAINPIESSYRILSNDVSYRDYDEVTDDADFMEGSAHNQIKDDIYNFGQSFIVPSVIAPEEVFATGVRK